MRILLLLTCLGVACDRSSEPERRAAPLGDAPSGVSGPPAACAADADCVICSNGECGVPLARSAASTVVDCAIGALCEPWVPSCSAGACIAAPPPGSQRCRSDGDCGICRDGSRCGQPMARARMRALGAACERGSAAGCRPLRLLCHEGRCKDASLLNQ